MSQKIKDAKEVFIRRFIETVLDVSGSCRNDLCDYEETLDKLYAFFLPPGWDWSRIHSIAGRPRIGRGLYRELVTRLFRIALDAERTPRFLDLGFDLDTELHDWDVIFDDCYVTYEGEDRIERGFVRR